MNEDKEDEPTEDEKIKGGNRYNNGRERMMTTRRPTSINAKAESRDSNAV